MIHWATVFQNKKDDEGGDYLEMEIIPENRDWAWERSLINDNGIREIAIALFSRGMTSGRVYHLGKGDQWLLFRVGDI